MTESGSTLSTEPIVQIESFVDDYLTDNGVPGASVAITDENEVLYAKGFGAREFASNTPATPETLYRVASITKTVTAVAVLQLVEDGRLSLSDPVEDHVDYFEAVPGEPITVEELLSHTSGVPSDDVATITSPRLGDGDGPTVPLSSGEEFRRHVNGAAAARRATDEPRCMYYNSGYAVLGEVIGACTGRSYAEYVEENVLDPLGMSRSAFDREAVEAEADRTAIYETTEEGRERREFRYREQSYPNGGLVSSVTDLARFLRGLMNADSTDTDPTDTNSTDADPAESGAADARPADSALLGADALATMTTPRGRFRTLVDGTDEEYALGAIVRPLGDDTLVGHGGTWGCSGYAGYLADAGLGVAILCNTVPDTHPMEVGPALLGLAQGMDAAAANPYFAVREKLEFVAGTYESHRGLQSATVERAGLALEVTIGSGDRATSYTCFPESAAADSYEFYTLSQKLHRLPVEFVVGDDAVDLFVDRNRLTKQG